MSTAKDGGKKTAAERVAPATGKLGVMVVGLGAVATTMIAEVKVHILQANLLPGDPIPWS
jgi:myo-inositol-1-phosphate synthase